MCCLLTHFFVNIILTTTGVYVHDCINEIKIYSIMFLFLQDIAKKANRWLAGRQYAAVADRLLHGFALKRSLTYKRGLYD